MMRRIALGLATTFKYWMQTEVHVYAFSVAANVLLSFFPFLIVMMSVSRLFFDQQATRNAVDLALRDYFPDSFGTFLLNNLPTERPAQTLSIVLLLFTANGIFEPLEVALNRIWGIRKNRSFFRNQLISLALIFVCGGLALGSTVLAAMNQETLKGLMGGADWVSIVFFKFASVPVAALVLFLIYRYLPNGRPPLDRVLAAAVSVALLMEALKYSSKLVWPWFFQKLTREYGVFRYSMTLIFLGFMASMLVLAGAEWSARGHRIGPLSGEILPGEIAND